LWRVKKFDIYIYFFIPCHQLAEKGRIEDARIPVNEAVFKKEQAEKAAREEEEKKKQQDEEVERREAGTKNTMDRKGILKVKPPKKDWRDSEVSLQGFTLSYSKVKHKDRGTKTVVAVNMPSFIVTPASESEVGKEALERAFKLTDKSNSSETLFIAETKQESSEWMEVLTLASLSLSRLDLNSPDRYTFGRVTSSTIKGLKLEGFDSRGNSFLLPGKPLFFCFQS